MSAAAPIPIGPRESVQPLHSRSTQGCFRDPLALYPSRIGSEARVWNLVNATASPEEVATPWSPVSNDVVQGVRDFENVDEGPITGAVSTLWTALPAGPSVVSVTASVYNRADFRSTGV